MNILVFHIKIDSQEIRVRYTPDFFTECAHFEFLSANIPRTRIPISETRYLSRFVPMHELEYYSSVEQCAEALAAVVLMYKLLGKDQDQNRIIYSNESICFLKN